MSYCRPLDQPLDTPQSRLRKSIVADYLKRAVVPGMTIRVSGRSSAIAMSVSGQVKIWSLWLDHDGRQDGELALMAANDGPALVFRLADIEAIGLVR